MTLTKEKKRVAASLWLWVTSFSLLGDRSDELWEPHEFLLFSKSTAPRTYTFHLPFLCLPERGKGVEMKINHNP
jgi:hypothetical protein